MKREAVAVTSLLASLLAASCGNNAKSHSHSHSGTVDPGISTAGAGGENPLGASESTAYNWNLPQAFPDPWEPTSNPTTEAKVELGRHLFYDTRLSGNGTQSCASCHKQELAFTDGRKTGLGSTGEPHPRSSMSLANIGFAASLSWANPLLTQLEDQALLPMFGEFPVELGLTSAEQLEERLRGVPKYVELFAAAFPEATSKGTVAQVAMALAAFERTLISGDSPYDRWFRTGHDPEFGDAERRGYELFNSEKLECFHCHLGFNLSDHVHYRKKPFYEAPFHNTGLYNIDGKGAYPEPNTGVNNVTSEARDMGAFKTPTLRNIGVTAPYMHDGSIATLEEVLDHYAHGGRALVSGPNQGDGSKNPYKSQLLVGFTLTAAERADVVAFLNSLTDQTFLTNPAYSNPWPTTTRP